MSEPFCSIGFQTPYGYLFFYRVEKNGKAWYNGFV